MKPASLHDNWPADLSQEAFLTLLNTPHVRIERIISHGQASPECFWYDQPTGEWVLLLEGAARLRFEGEEPFEMMPGSFINIPAHKRHRVEWTSDVQTTVWLAVHYTG